MFASVFEWLKGLTIFVIVCETTLGFSPTLQYKRYLKPFVGFVILLRIMTFLIGNHSYELKLDVDELFEKQEISFGNIMNDNRLNKDLTDELNEAAEEEIQPGMRIHIEDICFTPIEVGEGRQ